MLSCSVYYLLPIHYKPKTSLLADEIADVILEDLALALKVLSLDKLAKLCLLRLVALHLLTVKG